MTSQAEHFDIAIIGGGIAGASLGAYLAGEQKVIVLEAEPQAGYHTTGRSAAVFCEIYGPSAVRALTRASASFFKNPDNKIFPACLLSPRGVIMLAHENQEPALQNLFNEIENPDRVEMLGKEALHNAAPLLKENYGNCGLLDRETSDVDVNTLHQGYLQLMKQAGGQIKLRARVEKLGFNGQKWELFLANQSITASIIVNAAGAWADEIGKMAGALPIGLVPKRRTALIVEAPDFAAIENMPLIVDVDEQFYLKPESGKLLISPADETPSPACDVQPEELDIAICIDRIETAFEMNIRRIENKWAGLRSFVKDKCPVIGFDENVPGFFWMAGQGGYGIQTAPAAARLGASLILKEPLPQDILDQGLDIKDYSPARLRDAT